MKFFTRKLMRISLYFSSVNPKIENFKIYIHLFKKKEEEEEQNKIKRRVNKNVKIGRKKSAVHIKSFLTENAAFVPKNIKRHKPELRQMGSFVLSFSFCAQNSTIFGQIEILKNHTTKATWSANVWILYYFCSLISKVLVLF